MVRWRLTDKMKLKIGKNPRTNTSNKFGYLNEKLCPHKKQNITNFSSYDPHKATALIQGKANSNPNISVTTELQKNIGLLYANITKFR
jgi:hypothetical protein